MSTLNKLHGMLSFKMSAKANNSAPAYQQQQDYLFSASIISEDGREIEITQEMIDDACEQDIYEIYPSVSKRLKS